MIGALVRRLQRRQSLTSFAPAKCRAARPRYLRQYTSGVRVAAHLADNLTTFQDAQDLAIAHGTNGAATTGVVRPIVVVKVGGEVITKDADNLVASLRFLAGFGLQVRRRRDCYDVARNMRTKSVLKRDLRCQMSRWCSSRRHMYIPAACCCPRRRPSAQRRTRKGER